MIDSVQLVLLLVIIILTILLVVLGVQVFFILQDFRKTIFKANKVLDNVGSITDNITGPLAALGTVMTSFKAGSIFTLVKFIRAFLSSDEDEVKTKKRE